MRYFEPWNAGLASETGAACRRLSKLLNALSDQINENIAQGEIVEVVRDTRIEMIRRLKDEGWRVWIDDNDNWQVRPAKN